MSMETYKVGIKRFTDIVFNGEIWQVNGEYWTTVQAESETQAKRLARHNLSVKIAQNEWFTCKNVRYWKNIYIYLSDLVIGG